MSAGYLGFADLAHPSCASRMPTLAHAGILTSCLGTMVTAVILSVL